MVTHSSLRVLAATSFAAALAIGSVLHSTAFAAVATEKAAKPATSKASTSQPAAKAATKAPEPVPAVLPADLGYRGIWFTLGQFSEHGDKYSGGLGTYTANHNPLAVHAPEVGRTFFVYGGVPQASSKHLLCMIGCYDHRTGRVQRPVLVHDKLGVDDPHDNPSLNIDREGHLWVFVSGRANKRPGYVYRSAKPYDIERFERIDEKIVTYPQPWYDAQRGFLLLFTRYTKGRELYWETSPDGRTWSETRKLAGFGGHYQTSGMGAGKVASFFNYHPGGNVDKRTNLYYAQSVDHGKTWTTASGAPLTLPLATVKNEALVRDYQAEGRLLYTCDLNFDAEGRPILLYVLSRDHRPGPAGGPREWTVAHWTGSAWEYSTVAASDHNYDMGSLYVDGSEWRVIAPTATGPQPWGGGGEMELWVSRDAGRSWTKERRITDASPRNHNYARRPRGARDPFFAFWADGNPDRFGESHLYFSDARGERVWRLPDTMTEPWATPVLLTAKTAQKTAQKTAPTNATNTTEQKAGTRKIAATAAAKAPAAPKRPDDLVQRLGDGYRGIWYMNQPTKDEHVYKYSGGFATYPQQHTPIAIHVPSQRKTFFVFGGSAGHVSERDDELQHLVSYYDHATGTVPRPVVLLQKRTEDAHDNPTLSIDADGYLFVFSSAHGTSRPSYVHRSRRPYDITAWELLETTNFSYTQPWHLPQARRFLFLHTLYVKGQRTLNWKTSADGRTWSAPSLLAHIEQGNYQVSQRDGNTDRVATAFDLHPDHGRAGKGLNYRTNIYYLETRDAGATWTTVDGRKAALPLRTADNPALVRDYRSENLNCYLKDIAFTAEGHPVILYLTSKGYNPGPQSAPFQWHTARWTGRAWEFLPFTTSDHNYDHGSLIIEADGTWRVVAPTAPGPQPWGTGGEIVLWLSRDQGKTWKMDRQLTNGSVNNHTYVRKPVNADPGFYAFWADGSALKPTESSLYFATREGAVYRLPSHMDGPTAKPEALAR